MSEINYQALREAAQNYQSTLAWYEAIADNPNAEQDCNEAVAALSVKSVIRKWTLSPSCWKNWKPKTTGSLDWKKSPLTMH